MSGIGIQQVRFTLLAGSIALAGGAMAQQTSVPDAQIEANVLRALASAPELSTQNIQSSTVYGTVTLTGNVHDETMRTKAENLVSRAPGVKKVVDELTLGDAPANSDQAQADPGQQPGSNQAGPDQQGAHQSEGSEAPAPPQPSDQAMNTAPVGPNQQQNQQPDYSQQPTQGQPQGQPSYGPPQGQDNGQYPPQYQAQQPYGPPQQGQPPYGPPQGQPPYGPPQGQPSYGPPQGQPSYGPPQGQQGNGAPQGQYPGQPQQYPGQAQPYPGQAQPYPGQAQPYPGQAQQYPGQQPYGPDGRRPMYQTYPPQAYPAQGGQQAGLPVTVPAGALLRIRINRGLDSNHIQPGAQFDGTVLSDIPADGAIAIPRGATVQGTVVDAKKAGALKGQGELGLQITSVTLGGEVYPIETDVWQREGRDKSTTTVNSALGMGALGAIVGGIAGGGAGAAVGAGVGAGVGVAGAAGSPGGRVIIPPEAVLTFHISQPTVVRTVSQEEMARLAYAAGQPYGPPRPRPVMRRYYSPYYGYYYAPYPYAR